MILIDDIVASIQLAMAFEVSGYPKPGNVDRLHDYEDTFFEHFIASAIGMGGVLREAALRGKMVREGKIKHIESEIGLLMKKAVEASNRWQSGGNTHLGTIILVIPIALGAGYISDEKEIDALKLRNSISQFIKNTTPYDTLNLYDAIRLANPAGLGKIKKYDVTEDSGKQEVIQDNITMLDIFNFSASYDNISREWVTNFEVTFELGYPKFIYHYEQTKSINIATVHTFLEILSKYPDTLIARRAGELWSARASEMATEVLENGGLLREKGRKLLENMDKALREKENHLLNPGTTADFVASSISVACILGFRP